MQQEELMIFNRSLSPEQIASIYQDGLANHSINTIISNETKVGENWSVMVTPNDLYLDGTPKLSHNLTILSTPPTAPTLNLNSSSGANSTNENLTVYISGSTDADGNSIYNITDWRINGSSLAVLNMPFDNNNATNVTDYSTYGKSGNITGANWTSSGKVGGAYDFSSGGSIYIFPTNDLDVQNLTISLWFNTTNGGSTVWIFEKGTINTQYSLILAFGNLTFRTVNASATIGSFPGLDLFNFNGRMDELMIFNRSLSAEQIASIYQDGLANHSVTKIVSNETKVGENWSVMVTPNDLYLDGTPKLSHNLTILSTPPTAPTLNLNSSSGANSTNE